MYKGIGVSQGIVMGTALWLRNNPLSFNELHEDVDHLNLGEIIEQTKKVLQQMEAEIANNIGQAEASIFEMHQLILEDDYLIEQIEELQKKGVSLKDSVRQGLSTLSEQFSKLTDDYMRERSGDFNNLLQLMMGVIEGNLKQIDFPPGTVLVTDELYPSDIIHLQAKEVIGVISGKGGSNGHAAILARSLGKPAVLGLGNVINEIVNGIQIVVDGESGLIIIEPNEQTLQSLHHKFEISSKHKDYIDSFRYKKAALRDGTRVHMLANAAKTVDAKDIEGYQLDGIGLFRTEYLYYEHNDLPSEEVQFEYYKSVLSTAGEKSVTFRTFDIGGDKAVPQLTVSQETNPFLGLRGIRLALYHSQAFRIHLRALVRASHYGRMEIMFPFICNVQEVLQAKKLLQEVMSELTLEGHSYDSNIPVGIMVEIPSAAINIESFIRHCDFVSIGTNDLVQYTLGIDRTNPLVADLYREEDPAVLELIAKVASAGQKYQVPVSVCGEMAGNPKFTEFLIGLGIAKLSMSVARSSEIKEILSRTTLDECAIIAAQMLHAGT
ncbi:phosphoenolpyruvate--protein phosphotransferase [Paenibacillus sediminis]|nr:phosphoenolpyruvate--protein phosphotransferase [Paenibacillus sediminis]